MNYKLMETITKSVVNNFEEIVGIHVDQVEFNINMDANFLDESLEKIYEWTEKKYKGIDVREDEDFLLCLDKAIIKKQYRDWEYMF